MYHLLILFFVTFSAAFMATVPPGLLNMNAAKTSVEQGRRNGIVFSFGVAIMVLIQTFIAVNISKFLNQNPEVVTTLTKIALVIFLVLAVYFFWKKNTNKNQNHNLIKWSKKKPFLRGFLLAAVNVLILPYYSTLNIMWNKAGWIKFEITDILVFVLAASTGTFAVLYLYVFYFNKLDNKESRFAKHSNQILGFLMLVLALICVFRIWF